MRCVNCLIEEITEEIPSIKSDNVKFPIFTNITDKNAKKQPLTVLPVEGEWLTVNRKIQTVL